MNPTIPTMKNTAPQFTLAEMRDGHWYIRRSNPSGTFTLLARLDAIPDGAQPGDWAEMVAALNERAAAQQVIRDLADIPLTAEVPGIASRCPEMDDLVQRARDVRDAKEAVQ